MILTNKCGSEISEWLLNFLPVMRRNTIWECGDIFYSLFQFVQFQSKWKCTDGFNLVDWRVWADFMTLVYKKLSLYLQLWIRFCVIKYQSLVSLSWYKAIQNIMLYSPLPPLRPQLAGSSRSTVLWINSILKEVLGHILKAYYFSLRGSNLLVS